MKNNRKLIINNKQHLHSFSELTGFSHERTKNTEKLQEQRDGFMKAYGKCSICGGDWKLVKDSNILVCGNQSCTGKKVETIINNEKVVTYEPSFLFLRSHSADVANTLFD